MYYKLTKINKEYMYIFTKIISAGRRRNYFNYFIIDFIEIKWFRKAKACRIFSFF